MRRDWDRVLPRQQQANGGAMSRGNALYSTLAAARSVQPGNRQLPQLRTPAQATPWYRKSPYGTTWYDVPYVRIALTSNPTWFNSADPSQCWPSSGYQIGYNIFPEEIVPGPVTGDSTTGSDVIDSQLALVDAGSNVLASCAFGANRSWDYSSWPHTMTWTLPSPPAGCAQANDLHNAVPVRTFNGFARLKADGTLATDARGPSYVYVAPYMHWTACRWEFDETTLAAGAGTASTGILWANTSNHAEAFPGDILYGPDRATLAFRRRCSNDLLWPCDSDYQSIPNPPVPNGAVFKLKCYDAAEALIGYFALPIPCLAGPIFPAGLSLVPDAAYMGKRYPRVCGVQMELTGSSEDVLHAVLSPVEEWIFMETAIV